MTRISALLVVCTMAGCAPVSMSLQPSFWQEGKRRIGVAMVKCPKAGAYKEGAQGVLDMAINSAMAGGLEAHLQTVDLSADLADLMGRFAQRLEAQGFSTKIVSEPLDSLQKFTPSSATEATGRKYSKQDVRFLASREQVDLLILLSVEQYGTIRKYYGFIPLGAPKGICILKGQMVDLQTNELRWVSVIPSKQATVSIIGAWDLPPDYPGITSAIKGAFQRAANYLTGDFFKSSPASTGTP